MIKHTIDTGESPPIHQLPCRIAQFWRGEERELLKGMLEKDIIQPLHSPWASPVVLVQKKDGSTRFCVDFRRVNVVTRKNAYPIS